MLYLDFSNIKVLSQNFNNSALGDGLSQGRQTLQNSGGGGGWRGIQSGSIFKKVHFLAFFRQTIKKDLLLDFYAIKRSTFYHFYAKRLKKVAF